MSDARAFADALDALAVDAAALDVDRAAFLAWLAPRLADEETAARPDAAHLRDLLVVHRCERGDPAAWRTVADELERLAPAALHRFSGDAAFRDEATARTLARLAQHDAASTTPRIARYQGRGPLAAWLRAVLVREAIDLRRADPGDQHLSNPDGLIDGAAPLIDTLVRASYAPLVHEALRRALRSLSARERAVIRWRFIDGATMAEIATLLGVHRATATRTLAELQERLRQHMRAELCTERAISVPDLDSILRVVTTRLDSSLRSILAESLD